LDEKVYDPNAPTVIEFALRAGLRAVRMSPDQGIKLLMPLETNDNHVGTMYAGALFTLAEVMGGAAFRTYMLNREVFPIVKGLNIKFVKPARTDITAEFAMDQGEADRILAECLEKGKADYDISLELKDEAGLVVAVSDGFYQIRKGTAL
jgi:acyl-coenzyme A thioesterase PaaI-like protein